MKTLSRSAGILVAAALALGSAIAPACARDSYVVDGAGLFGAATVSDINAQIGTFAQQTGKEIVVVTVPSYEGSFNDAVERTFAAQQVNGVLFYFAKAEQRDAVLGDRASQAFFPNGAFQTIHDAMRGYLRDGDYDQAIKTGVSLVVDGYRSHQTSAGGTQLARAHHYYSYAPARRTSLGGGMSHLFWFFLLLLAGFLIIRALFRAAAGPRMMPPPGGYGPGGGAGGYGPGYGGYGPGYGYGGGGGFFSGLLGGLGGAWLGNELFNRGGQGTIDPGTAGVIDGGAAPDASGWQADPGQADMGNMGGGSWGDSGGGFDPGGGGDFGGGGGGFDSGGGW